MMIDDIIVKTVEYLCAQLDGMEISTSDAVNAACGFEYSMNGECLIGGTSVEFVRMFDLDRKIRRMARKSGLIIDESIYADMIVGLPFNVPYLVRKKPQRTKNE